MPRVSQLGLSFFCRAGIRIQYQNEAAECGLACLAMLSSYHGHTTSVAKLRRRWPISLNGLTLAQLVNIAEELNLSARPLQLEINELRRLRIPCIAHWSMDHFVIVERVGRRRLTIVDPAVGRQKVGLNEASRRFTGVVLEAWPAKGFAPHKSSRSLKLSQFFTNAKGIGSSLVQLLLLSVALQIFALATPFYGQLVIDNVVISNDTDLLTVLALGFTALTFVMVVTGAFRSWIIIYIGSHLSFEWSANLFRHLVRLPYDYFVKREVGDIQSRFRSLGAIRDLITTHAIEAIVDGLMAATTIVVMAVYSPVLTAIVVVSVLAYLAVRMTLYESLRSRSLKFIVCTATADTYFLESVRGVLAVKNFAREQQREVVYRNRLAESVKASAASAKIGIWHDRINQMIFGLQNVFVIWIAAKLIIATEITIGMMIAFLAYKFQFTNHASALVDKVMQFRLAGIHLDRLSDIVETEQEQFGASDSQSSERRVRVRGRVELRNVWYRYGKNESYAVAGTSFDVDEGEQVAIVGPSGTGKSTLMKLMVGLLQPEKGTILYGGRSIEQIGLAGFRRSIGVVMQNDQLLGGTLLDNITFFDLSPDYDLVDRCVTLAGITDDIASMPMGLYTLVGDMGDALSGGQRQRVMLARALYQEPTILFLDEATSHLDSHREAVTVSQISSLNMTRVIIAHRQESIRHCNRVIKLDSAAHRT